VKFIISAIILYDTIFSLLRLQIKKTYGRLVIEKATVFLKWLLSLKT